MAWLSLLIVVLIAGPGLAGFGRLLIRRWLRELDPALALGLSALVGMGIAGTLAYFVGFASITISHFLVWGLIIAGWALLLKDRPVFTFRRSALGLAVASSFIPAIGVVAPSTMMDWDSIAYHLAVPKIWIADGKVGSVSFIHHSNFPFAVDGLNLFALPWGGQAAAKAFQVAFLLFGLLALFGLVREKFGEKPAWWSCAAFATIPLVQWESGSAYIDVAHGLFAGLGAILAIQSMRASADRAYGSGRLMIGAILMGLALGSKYTGLQSLFALGIVLIALMAIRKTSFKPIAVGLGLALLVGGPWYIKNAALVQNPVYPFFYEKLGGKNWDQRQADVYRNEQKTFGVPSAPPLSIGHAIIGMAYQPGRYVNPLQELRQVEGKPFGAGGYPIGAAGFAIFLAGLFVAFRRPSEDNDEAPILAWLLICLLMWAFLSQQSRYALSFAPPLCFLLGSVLSRRHWFAPALMGAVVVQGLVTLFFAKKDLLLTQPRLHVAFGRTDEKTYLTQQLPFYEATQKINEDASIKKVALFDEVFGFYLDKPYFWASYGHTTEMGYETMSSSDDFVAALKRLGCTHAHVNLRVADPEFRDGLVQLVQSGSATVDPARYIADPQARWKGFMLQALAEGKLTTAITGRSWVVFAVK